MTPCYFWGTTQIVRRDISYPHGQTASYYSRELIGRERCGSCHVDVTLQFVQSLGGHLPLCNPSRRAVPWVPRIMKPLVQVNKGPESVIDRTALAISEIQQERSVNNSVNHPTQPIPPIPLAPSSTPLYSGSTLLCLNKLFPLNHCRYALYLFFPPSSPSTLNPSSPTVK